MRSVNTFVIPYGKGTGFRAGDPIALGVASGQSPPRTAPAFKRQRRCEFLDRWWCCRVHFRTGPRYFTARNSFDGTRKSRPWPAAYPAGSELGEYFLCAHLLSGLHDLWVISICDSCKFTYRASGCAVDGNVQPRRLPLPGHRSCDTPRQPADQRRRPRSG